MKKISLILLIFILINACKSEDTTKDNIIYMGDNFYKVETFEIDSGKGWGYKIYKNDRVYIDQELIPAVNGYFVFATSEDAKTVGDFVLHRLITRKGMPSVTVSELDSLGVLSQEILDFQKIDFGTKTGILPGK